MSSVQRPMSFLNFAGKIFQMQDEQKFFAEFPEISKSQWLARVAKDLKNRQPEDLFWQINERISVDPFGHADDFPEPILPLENVPNNWEINEKITTRDAAEANRQALEALHFGAESLTFDFETLPTATDFAKIFEKIHLDFISIHFSGRAVRETPGYFLALLTAEAAKKNIPTKNLRGSLAFDPADAPPGSLVDWRYLLDLMDFVGENFPHFQVISVAGNSHFQNLENVDNELADLLQKGNIYLKKLTERGAKPENVAAAMQFSMTVGKSYFLEISKLRAFKLLWLNILEGWQVAPVLPKINVEFLRAAYSDDLYKNMIAATSMSMSAVLGGANRLTVLPYDFERENLAKYPQNFSRRIARNVQHLLKMESGFHEISDAAAGSFCLEKLTRQLAESAWKIFQKK